MNRFTLQLVLLAIGAGAACGCARRWGRNDLTGLDPLLGDRPEASAPVLSKYASSQSSADANKGETEKSPVSIKQGSDGLA